MDDRLKQDEHRTKQQNDDKAGADQGSTVMR